MLGKGIATIGVSIVVAVGFYFGADLEVLT